MTRRAPARPAVAALAVLLASTAGAQPRPVEAAPGDAALGAPRVAAPFAPGSALLGTIGAPSIGLGAPLSAPTLSAPAAAASPRLSAPAASGVAAAPDAQPAAVVPVALEGAAPAAVVDASAPSFVSAPAADAATPRPANAPRSSDARQARAEKTVADGAAAWLERTDGASARPRAARAAFAAGATFVAAAAVATFAPHALVPAFLAAHKGAALWGGFGFLALSRYWRAPSAARVPGPSAPVAAPAANGPLAHFRALWAKAAAAAEAQATLEARVGNGSLASLRDWLLGGLRAAALWLPATLGAMAAGAALGKIAELASRLHLPAAAAPASIAKLGFLGMALGPLAGSLAQLAAQLFVFDLARRALAGRVAERAAGLIAGAVVLAATGAVLLTLTHSPFVILATLASDAVMLALRARSRSWLAPLALGGIFSVFSLDSARFAAWLKFGAAGTLVGLPGWTGAAVAAMLVVALVWAARGLRPSKLISALKAQAASVRGVGTAPAPENGAPRSPRPLLKLAGLWGLILYALGDLSWWAVHAVAGGAEPAPASLAKMLTSPIDLVLYNFLIVGFLEEYVFRRNLFKPLRDRLAKFGASPRAAFWTAAVGSALIFSGAHYVDYGALLAKLGLMNATAAAGLGGAYAFTWAGFAARAVLGVALAWLYAASGVLLLPILAHAAADTFEGLGLRWGVAPFLALVAVVLLAQGAGARLLGWFKKLHSQKLSAFQKATCLAAFAAAGAPVLWGAAPALKLAFLLGSASVLGLAALATISLTRLALARLRPSPGRAAAPRRRLVGAVLGVALGLAVGSVPVVAPGPLVTGLYAAADFVRHDHQQVRAVPGRSMADETLAVLSRNPVGREVLERLRDRGGVVRLPAFYVRSSNSDTNAMVVIVAQHEGLYDGLYVGAGLLRDHGWTVEQFLGRPELQRQLVDEIQATLAHELTHAVQSRRSPLARDTWTMNSMEHEYEAFAVQNLYVHAQLQADPRAKIDADTFYEYQDALDRGLVQALKSHDADYPQDRHVDSPSWDCLRARIEARWPALRVEGYVLLARRQTSAFMAEAYMKKARAAAAQAGLPAPTLEAPAGSPASVVEQAWTPVRGRG